MSQAPEHPPIPRLTYGPAEVAEMLGTSEWWVREQCRRRRVTHLRVGKRGIRFRDSDLPAILAMVEVPAQEVVKDPAVQPTVESLELIGLTPQSLRRRRA